MKIRILKPKNSVSPAKLTVQKSGKMSFSKGSVEMLGIEQNRFVKFGIDENNNLYLFFSKKADEETFKISRTGQYYYIMAKALLEDIGIDYSSPSSTVFEIRKNTEGNGYRLQMREPKVQS